MRPKSALIGFGGLAALLPGAMAGAVAWAGSDPGRATGRDGPTPAVSDPSSPTACEATVMDTGFVPPPPFSEHPAAFGGPWADTADLWTTIPPDDSGRARLAMDDKTFWWSLGFDPAREPNPAIEVVATKIGGSGESFSNEHQATHGWANGAPAFMLVGLSFPSPGCWEVRAVYRGHTFTYVANVGQ